MATLRQRLHFWVAAWLVFQVATLSALVPRDCCAAHKDQHQKKASHATAGAEHAGHHQAMNHEVAHQTGPEAPIEQCVLRGTCKGPMSAIVALLSNQGVPPLGSFTIAPRLLSTLVAGSTSEHVSSRLASPDPPPPRA